MTQNEEKEPTTVKPLISKQYFKNSFKNIGQNPINWLYRAEILKKAADKTLEQMEADENAATVEGGWVDPVYKYLAGVTIENLLKGIIIAKHPELITNDQMDKNLAKHDIWRRQKGGLLQDIAPLLTQEERDLLKVLEIHVIWRGRYPIAKSAKIYAQNQFEDQELSMPRKKLKDVFNSLHDKLLEELGNRDATYVQARFGTQIQ